MHAAFIARVTWSFVVQVSAGAASLPDTQVPDGLYSLLVETQQENGKAFFLTRLLRVHRLYSQDIRAPKRVFWPWYQETIRSRYMPVPCMQ